MMGNMSLKRERQREREVWGEREREAVERENSAGHLRRWHVV
jgi:hypothetical protein